ncbi:MAG: hypothetical protein WC234_01165 [Endomicrobiaceae bacterium]
MNKKQISIFLAVLMFFNATSLFAADKKDVSDPVLRQILSDLENKMPRFIDKYGQSVFVADEQITRGSLIMALYEYDKKMSGSGGSGAVSKRDFDLLNTRLTALEKTGSSKGLGAPRTAVSADVDIIKVMNDLEPNMPMLLDNSLENSKVFKALQQKVEMAGVAGTSSSSMANSKTSSAALYNIQKNIADLNKKVDNFEISLSSAKSGSGKMSDAQVSANISNMQRDITNLNKKVSDFEFSLSSAKSGSGKMSDAQVSANISNMQREINNMSNRISSVENSLMSKNNSSYSDQNYSQDSLKELANLKRSLIQMQKSYVAVSKRVDELENTPVVYSGKKDVSSSQISLLSSKINEIKETVQDVPTNAYVKEQISKSNSRTTSNIKQLEKRLNNLERTGKSSGGDSSKSSGASTSTVAKISLGITMVAALFIAR